MLGRELSLSHFEAARGLAELVNGQARSAKRTLVDCIGNDPRYAESYLFLALYWLHRAYSQTRGASTDRFLWLAILNLESCLALDPSQGAKDWAVWVLATCTALRENSHRARALVEPATQQAHSPAMPAASVVASPILGPMTREEVWNKVEPFLGRGFSKREIRSAVYRIWAKLERQTRHGEQTIHSQDSMLGRFHYLSSVTGKSWGGDLIGTPAPAGGLEIRGLRTRFQKRRARMHSLTPPLSWSATAAFSTPNGFFFFKSDIIESSGIRNVVAIGEISKWDGDRPIEMVGSLFIQARHKAATVEIWSDE